MYLRIRRAKEQMGYTREQFAEKLDVSVSYLAELERGKTGLSVKMLLKICSLFGLSADYVLFGGDRSGDELLLERIRRIDSAYIPMLNKIINEMLILTTRAKDPH